MEKEERDRDVALRRALETPVDMTAMHAWQRVAIMVSSVKI